MGTDRIVIRGAREHNLKNIDLELPRDRLIVFTGISGSGKSSLAFDTIYAEGQRRYVESLSTYARQFLGQVEKPDVESIEGLSPAISIEQKSVSHNPRSTVGTTTEVYDYLRLLYARVGIPHCPKCGRTIAQQTSDQITEHIEAVATGKKVVLMAPLIRARKGEHRALFESKRQEGFLRVRVDGEVKLLDEDIKLEKNAKHDIDLVVDRLKLGERQHERLAESVELALGEGVGKLIVVINDKEELLFSEHLACPVCGISIEEPEPAMFSFNSPRGACPACHGLGVRMEFDPELLVPDGTMSIIEGAISPWGGRAEGYYMQMLKRLGKHYDFSLFQPFESISEEAKRAILWGASAPMHFELSSKERDSRYSFVSQFEGVIPSLKRRYRETKSEEMRSKLEQYMTSYPCELCDGMRLKRESLAFTIGDKNLTALTQLSVKDLVHFLDALELSHAQLTVATPILKEIRARLNFLMDVGLEYLTLDRLSGTLSGGEAQRIRLATQIGSKLVGVLYVLDEPSIGLHQRDNARLICTLLELRDIGNTVIVVEHDEEMMLCADHIVDIGVGAGVHGGKIVAEGAVEDIKACPESLTGKYLSRKMRIEVPSKRRTARGQLTIVGASEHNLKHIDVSIPLGVFTCITGVSGSGKSTLISDILHRALAQMLYGAKAKPGNHEHIVGTEQIDKVITIDQSPIGRTPRSNPATYTGAFTPIRELFSKLEESRLRGYKPGRFSFNVKGGRCEACRGEGVITIEMHFLPDIYMPCEVCKGSRYNRETLEVKFKGKTISDVLEMTVEEALELFKNIPAINRKLSTLVDVGLGYIKLGQPATTLSGGEAQRVKLSTELSKRSTGRTLYILDEPTTGLHFDDIKKLLSVLQRLVDAGNTVIVIEHNLDVIKCADHIIDLGPEGGDEGGEVVCTGTPEEVMAHPSSYTGEFLKRVLDSRDVL